MMMQPFLTQQQIRPIALCIFRRDQSILVAEGYDHHKQQTFYRPPGGGLMFGEYSWETVRREIKEELGEDIKNLTFLGPTENVFQYEGEQGHEIVFIFEGEFANKRPYQVDELVGHEDNGTAFRAVWKPIADFRRKKAILYPDGLLDYLMK